MDGLQPHASPRTILVGPGSRLATLPALLGAVRPRPTWEVRALADIDELFGPLAAGGRAIVDCDDLDLEDVGFVRRFLDRHPDWDVVLTGADPSARTCKRLVSHERARWLDWPLDVEQLQALWGHDLTPGATAPTRRRRAAPAPERGPLPPSATLLGTSPAALERDDELAEIESILEDTSDLGGPPPADPDDYLPAMPSQAIPSALAGSGGPSTYRAPARRTDASHDELPAFYREQVADLADLAQRLDLSARALGDSIPPASDAGTRVNELRGDVSRLMQFTRTLSFLGSPPPAGDQSVDVASLLEELLSGLAGATPESPRFLFRATHGAVVATDKLLLVQAFDALLQLAARCSGPDDVVRVALGRSGAGEDVTRDPVEVRISFPAGPLADFEPERILRPYALRRVLPTIGPNALAAAGGILRGQGGQLALEESDQERLAFVASLPAPVPASDAGQPVG